jgi:hypothetical protein
VEAGLGRGQRAGDAAGAGGGGAGAGRAQGAQGRGPYRITHICSIHQSSTQAASQGRRKPGKRR